MKTASLKLLKCIENDGFKNVYLALFGVLNEVSCSHLVNVYRVLNELKAGAKFYCVARTLTNKDFRNTFVIVVDQMQL